MKRVEREDEKFGGKIRIRSFYKGSPPPVCPKFENIQAWSGGTLPWKQLSPFVIGPVTIVDDKTGTVIETALNFECCWQAWKVFDEVQAQNSSNWKWPKEQHVGEDGNPNEAWHKWHDALMKSKEAVRRPNGYAIPQYAWWKGQKLGIVEARKQIYIPLLQELYRKSPTYVELLKMVKNGTNILILEPDGPPAQLYPLGLEVDLELLVKLQDVTQWSQLPGMYTSSKKYVPYGHGYVIALTLLEDVHKKE